MKFFWYKIKFFSWSVILIYFSWSFCWSIFILLTYLEYLVSSFISFFKWNKVFFTSTKKDFPLHLVSFSGLYISNVMFSLVILKTDSNAPNLLDLGPKIRPIPNSVRDQKGMSLMLYLFSSLISMLVLVLIIQ